MKGFAGIIIVILLLNILISFEQITNEKTEKMLDSKQRIIEYQKTEQKRVEFKREFELVASASAKTIKASMETGKATVIFCTGIIVYLNPVQCVEHFWVDVFQKKAILKKDLTLRRDNYKITFQEGGYFK